MTHSDDNGLILPPKLAPTHVVIMPIIHKEEQRAEINAYCEQLADELRKIQYHQKHLVVEIDRREITGGEKAWSWVKKGVPIRIEVGSKECQAQSVFVGRRDKEYKERAPQDRQQFLTTVVTQLDELQDTLLQRARGFLQRNTVEINNKADFYEFFTQGEGGFALAHWNGDPEIEAKIKSDLNVTIRCIPLVPPPRTWKMYFHGCCKPSAGHFCKSILREV